MAKRSSIASALAREAAEETVTAPEAASSAVPAARSPRPPARKVAEKADPEPRTEIAPEKPKTTTPTVLVAPSVANAERVGLYLHPDDKRALDLAKLDDKADANARIRAMIAVWRANPRFRSQVDRLARTASKK